MKTGKKFVVPFVILGILVFLLICTAESLIALRKAIRERDAAVSGAEEAPNTPSADCDEPDTP